MATWYNDETESEMVEMWRSEPLLYTTTSKGCSHRHKKNAASYKIAEYFRTTGMCCIVYFCVLVTRESE